MENSPYWKTALTVQSQMIQCQTHLAVTRSRHVPLIMTQIMAVTILIGDNQDIIVVVVAGPALVRGQVPCQALTQIQMWSMKPHLERETQGKVC